MTTTLLAIGFLLLVAWECAASFVQRDNQPAIKRVDDTPAQQYQLDVYSNATLTVSGASTSTTTTTLPPDWV